MKKIYFVIFILAFFIGYIGKEVYSILYPVDSMERVEIKPFSCDLQTGPCSFQTDELSGELWVENLPILINKRNKLFVRFKHETDQKLELDFFGLDFDMGYNREKLKPSGEKTYETAFFLPTCVKPEMLWQMTLITEDEGLQFKFKTTRK